VRRPVHARDLVAAARVGLARGWRFVRDACGDSAYETYLAHAPQGPRLSREEFYLDSLRRRYSQPSRCC
jgi:uncharacterized short protein YbdD (DUF466 family)